jgi:CRISPR-associated endonuclease/helicase Cas3
MGAWARANLPEKWRHEALSVRLALLNPRLHEARDRGLVLWLVGVHHGLGRPFFPHEDKADDGDRDIAAVKDLTNGHVPTGRGPQSLGFIVPDEMAFAARDGREADDDLRGMDWHTLFRALKRRYGPWGLARLEAVLRLADHRASEAARDQGGDGDR